MGGTSPTNSRRGAFSTLRLRPYTRQRFERTYTWMQGYPDLITPGATYESVVDNRAWE